MNVSRRWLEAFLRRPLEARDVATRLAMLGAPVDAIEPLHADLSEIVVALVEEVRPHPNADRLRVCTVNAGGGTALNVVCGAANVAAGRKYPFAPVGSTIPGRPPKKPSLTLDRRKIRGEVSEGMLCSLEELGFEPKDDGIWELATDAAPGTPLLAALELADDRLVVDVTANRPDLLGHKGIARELAASLGVPFRLPPIPGAVDIDILAHRRIAESSNGERAETTTGGVRVAIEDAEGCARFHGVVLRDLRVAPSPEWLVRRLEAAGVRSINNVVDATNHVMLEFAQPMHAYDVARLRGPAVVARRGRAGERVVTLDGAEREVSDDMTVIADDGGVIGIGGVMGGRETEVHDGTTDAFLECAWFEPARIRRTRKALGISTDASYRFERGVDLWNAGEPFRRCIELVLTLAGGVIAEAPVDLWPRIAHPPRIFLRTARVAQVLGVELSLHEIERHLVSIGATVVSKPEDGRIAVDVPGWRPDLRAEIDLVEEVARREGYDVFPTDLRRFRAGAEPDAPVVAAVGRVRSRLVREGLLEAMTLPMVPAAGDGIRVANPVSEDHAMLRSALLPGLVRQAELNWSRRERDVRLFEIGAAFLPADPGSLPHESQRVAAVLTGARAPGHWSGAPPDLDLWDLKAVFEAAVSAAAPGSTIEPDGEGWVARGAEGRAIGRAAPLRADAPPWAAPLFGLEVELHDAAVPLPRFVARPATPSAERDVTLLVPDGVAAGAIVRALSDGGVTVLESVRIVNAYRGERVPPGTRSVTFRLTFRAPDRTLEAGEIDSAEAHLLLLLEREMGVRRRDQGESREG